MFYSNDWKEGLNLSNLQWNSCREGLYYFILFIYLLNPIGQGYFTLKWTFWPGKNYKFCDLFSALTPGTVDHSQNNDWHSDPRIQLSFLHYFFSHLFSHQGFNIPLKETESSAWTLQYLNMSQIKRIVLLTCYLSICGSYLSGWWWSSSWKFVGHT